MGIKDTRVYTKAERERGLKRTLEVGPTAASRELSIPVGTLASWAFYARKRGEVGSGAPAAAPIGPVVASGAGAAHQAVADPVAPSAAPISTTSRVSSAGAKRSAPTVAKSYTPTQRAAALELVARVGPAEASRELGISRFSLREWGRKQKQYAEGRRKESPLEGSDAAPKDERDRRILEVWRAHPGLGPSQVRNQLRRAGFKVSVHTVRVVLDAHGYVAPKTRRSEVHDRRYEAVRPNQLWHLDFLHRHINKQAVYVLLMVDDYSRFITGFWLDDAERADGVIQTFEHAVARYGRPESAMSDGGSGFWSWRGVSRFTRVLEEYGIDHLVAKVPQTNGKLEVLNANIQKELFNVERFFDLAETRRRLEGWVDFYNLRRTHHALGGILVPGDRYFGRAERVLAEIEAGRSSEEVGTPLPVSVRLLDLLRVTSQRGEIEVHLMGQKLWPPAG